MVLNDIIEQAAGRHSRASDHGGEFFVNAEAMQMCISLKYLNYVSYRSVCDKKDCSILADRCVEKVSLDFLFFVPICIN